MYKLYLLLVLGASLADPHGGAGLEDAPLQSVSPGPLLVDRTIQYDWPIFPFFNPNLYFNPYFNLIRADLFNSHVDKQKNDLEMIKRRQNLILKFAETSCPNSNNCKKVTQPDGTEDLRAINYWNWGFNRGDIEYVTSDRFYAVMNSFKTSIEKLTLRQNVVYEYVDCSCTAKNECSTSIKPVLDIMFANNGETTGQVIQSLLVPETGYNPTNNFFQTLASYFNQIPSWTFYNFNPFASVFGSPTSSAENYQPYSTSTVFNPSTLSPTSASSTAPESSSSSSASGSSASTSSQATQSTPASNTHWESHSSGNQPVYSSSSSYSSTTGSGQQVSGGHVSSGGGGKPSQEQHFISSNGGNVQVYSSNDGSGSKVSDSSSNKTKDESHRYVHRPGQAVNPGITAAEVGINAAQVGNQASQIGVQTGLDAAQQGTQASQIGVQTGLDAAQQGTQASQIGVQTGLDAAQQGTQASQIGVQTGLDAAQQGIQASQVGINAAHTGKKVENAEMIRERSPRYVYGPGYPVNPGIAAAQVGINAAQVGIQAGMIGAQQGIQASQIGSQAGQIGAQQGIHASQVGINAGMYAAQQSIQASQVGINAANAGLYGVPYY